MARLTFQELKDYLQSYIETAEPLAEVQDTKVLSGVVVGRNETVEAQTKISSDGLTDALIGELKKLNALANPYMFKGYELVFYEDYGDFYHLIFEIDMENQCNIG